MKSYPTELREKIVAAHIHNKISIRQVTIRFSVTKSLVQKLGFATQNGWKFRTIKTWETKV
ncbi:MAG: hypothetical protein WBA93_02145 [Microcoleaceae cyanobacterium]